VVEARRAPQRARRDLLVVCRGRLARREARAAAGRGVAVNVTRADLKTLQKRHVTVSRRPRWNAKKDRPKAPDPSMAPSKAGLTPAFTTPGLKKYMFFSATRVAVAVWSDDRERVPVTWMTHEQWRSFQWPANCEITGLDSPDSR
jgi:hypothetical protein